MAFEVEPEWMLESIANMVRECSKCTLGVTRKNAVPGEGSPRAAIMFIGEGPGANEDEQGRPFVGAAGNLLTKLLGYIQVNREDVFITNIVKCRPPQNRVPQKDEVEACKPFLMSQIAMIKPAVIVTLGSPSLKTMLGSTHAISSAHGKLQIHEGLRFLPMYHPAAYLHKRSPELLDTMKADFLELRKLLKQLN
ncbi:MAG TPA: uracil-DNA glycosylase [Caldisericia bacterium]|nr:uracil-DNA glycosylase [Caldisericia bacterium]HPF49135.1 uracil-DNA glycosylase [Caldisericia bacterium]HPI83001.1 uracil-DNA glycosylase [Caldisericia bacterium]HPQ92228.1 uracil-DNA glycosylase [Caldisericia bacterium]HRV74674.1 uracil-DNA glycosylase [Caldisericia bacterium]